MKIVICPDSFKGSLTATEAACCIEKAVLEVFPDANTTSFPMADGGEGTVEAIISGREAVYYSAEVTAPYGEKIAVSYPIIDNTAILEMAAASGLTLSDRRDVLNASSIGLGELIVSAVNNGAESIVLGIGGSATNDCGFGMLEGIGAKFYDIEGNIVSSCAGNLAKVCKVSLDDIDSKLLNIPIGVICDVTNPLLGENGATAIYGKQKGVTADMFSSLEADMACFAKVLSESTGKDTSNLEGAGAAGGVGFALTAALNAKLSKGIDLVMSEIDFKGRIEGADLVITGEGRLDRQSVEFGKLSVGITKFANNMGIPVVIVAGGIDDGAEAILNNDHYCTFITAVSRITDLETANNNAKEWVYSAALRAMKLIKISMEINSKN